MSKSVNWNFDDFIVNQELTDFFKQTKYINITFQSHRTWGLPFIPWQHNWLAFVARDGML